MEVSEPGPKGRRVAAIVEYDGTDYAGWQSQEHSASIQDAVQTALSFVAGHPIVAICAGRTDSGVHAAGQVIHFDTTAIRAPAPGCWAPIPSCLPPLPCSGPQR